MDSASVTIRHCRQSTTDGASRRWLFVVVAAVVVVRAVGLQQPLVGNFATKQAVYAMVARNWALDRAPIWQPTVDCLSADGERSWHLMEWPATAYATALLWQTCGGSLDVWGRIVGIACSAAAAAFAYLFACRRFGEPAARAASVFVGFAPLSIAYGRGFLLEPSLVAYSFAAVYGFDTWLRGGRGGWLCVAAMATSLAVVTKIYMLLLVVPLVGLAWEQLPWKQRAARRQWLIAAIVFAVAFAPTAAWYAWVRTVSPTSGPAADFHPISRAEIHAWPHPLLTSPSFYFQVLRDFATVAWTPIGLVLLVVGASDRRYRRYLPWLLASLLLVVAFPLKFQAANYYYLVLLPPTTLAVGLGWQRWQERFQPSPRVVGAVALAFMLISARYAVGPGYRVPEEDQSVTAAATALRDRAAVDERVATLHGSTIDLLYYCDRPGWGLNAADPQIVKQLDKLTNAGVERLVVADLAAAQRNAAFSDWLKSQTTEAAGEDWLIVRLQAPAAAIAATTGTAEFPPRREPNTATR